MISPKSLAKAGKDIYDELINHNLDEARKKVNYIVSRDANRMNEQDITRATVETVAENIVDGIISPLFYFFIGGLPLAVLYRMSNTMDAMIGYKNDKYLYFGILLSMHTPATVIRFTDRQQTDEFQIGRAHV